MASFLLEYADRSRFLGAITTLSWGLDGESALRAVSAGPGLRQGKERWLGRRARGHSPGPVRVTPRS